MEEDVYSRIMKKMHEFIKEIKQVNTDPSNLPLETRILKLQQDNDFSGKIFERNGENGNMEKYIGIKPGIRINAILSDENKLEWSVAFLSPSQIDYDGRRMYMSEFNEEDIDFYINGNSWYSDFDSLWKAVAVVEYFTSLLRENGGYLAIAESTIPEGYTITGVENYKKQS